MLILSCSWNLCFHACYLVNTKQLMATPIPHGPAQALLLSPTLMPSTPAASSSTEYEKSDQTGVADDAAKLKDKAALVARKTRLSRNSSMTTPKSARPVQSRIRIGRSNALSNSAVINGNCAANTTVGVSTATVASSYIESCIRHGADRVFFTHPRLFSFSQRALYSLRHPYTACAVQTPEADWIYGSSLDLEAGNDAAMTTEESNGSSHHNGDHNHLFRVNNPQSIKKHLWDRVSVMLDHTLGLNNHGQSAAVSSSSTPTTGANDEISHHHSGCAAHNDSIQKTLREDHYIAGLRHYILYEDPAVRRSIERLWVCAKEDFYRHQVSLRNSRQRQNENHHYAHLQDGRSNSNDNHDNANIKGFDKTVSSSHLNDWVYQYTMKSNYMTELEYKRLHHKLYRSLLTGSVGVCKDNGRNSPEQNVALVSEKFRTPGTTLPLSRSLRRRKSSSKLEHSHRDTGSPKGSPHRSPEQRHHKHRHSGVDVESNDVVFVLEDPGTISALKEAIHRDWLVDSADTLLSRVPAALVNVSYAVQHHSPPAVSATDAEDGTASISKSEAEAGGDERRSRRESSNANDFYRASNSSHIHRSSIGNRAHCMQPQPVCSFGMFFTSMLEIADNWLPTTSSASLSTLTSSHGHAHAAPQWEGRLQHWTKNRNYSGFLDHLCDMCYLTSTHTHDSRRCTEVTKHVCRSTALPRCSQHNNRTYIGKTEAAESWDHVVRRLQRLAAVQCRRGQFPLIRVKEASTGHQYAQAAVIKELMSSSAMCSSFLNSCSYARAEYEKDE